MRSVMELSRLRFFVLFLGNDAGLFLFFKKVLFFRETGLLDPWVHVDELALVSLLSHSSVLARVVRDSL